MLTDDILEKAVFVVAFLITEHAEALGKHAIGPLPGRGGGNRVHVTYPADFPGSRFIWGRRRGRAQLETWSGFEIQSTAFTLSKLEGSLQCFPL